MEEQGREIQNSMISHIVLEDKTLAKGSSHSHIIILEEGAGLLDTFLSLSFVKIFLNLLENLSDLEEDTEESSISLFLP